MLSNDNNIYSPYLYYDIDKSVTNVQVPYSWIWMCVFIGN